ncbi:MAG TPA: hypothetical protein VFC09_01100 [Candidatus Dormibacteraeota bacterium]|nr:hypothetical protein [Candidatus Dormibacteraeota bacterium]
MTEQLRTAIVVPTIRETSLADFLRRWEPEFRGLEVIVVEDNPEPTFDVPDWVRHYSWADIDATLGGDAWIIPRRSDCVRSFGYLMAYRSGIDVAITLDDDCYPESEYSPSYLSQFHAALAQEWPSDRWWNTLEDVFPRGVPYTVREVKSTVAVHHGLWSNVPDLDARTQMRMPDYRLPPARGVQRVPTGAFFPMCGMNLAFRREFIPAMYFLLMGQSASGERWPFDRFGDIWAGIFVKKIADHLGFAITSGSPSVHHSRASNVDANLAKETPGYPVNEYLWERVDRVHLTQGSVARCYAELAEKLDMDGEYWSTLKRAMRTWADLFDGD